MLKEGTGSRLHPSEISYSVAHSIGKQTEKMDRAEGSASAPDKPPPYSAHSTGVNSLFTVRYIDERKGFGLVATQDLPTGTLVFRERMLVFWERMESFASVSEFNLSLGEEVKAMGPEFVRGYFTLPTTSKDLLGILGGILEASKIMAMNNGKAVAMVGLNLAFVNHACVPNTQHTWIKPNFEGDGPDDQYHTVTLYACKHISAGEEITMAYHHMNMRLSLRREFTSTFFGFVCECDICTREDESFEKYLALIDEQLRYVHRSEMIHEHPAGMLQVGFTIGSLMEKCGIFDCRLARLFEQCAVIAGWHSDEARAMEFLAKAQTMFVNLEGIRGPDLIRVANFQKDLRTLPGFGRTKRALSKRREVKVLWLNPDKQYDMLFMRGLARHECKRLRNYEDVRGKESSYDDDDDDDEEAETEHGSQYGQESQQNQEAVTENERENNLNSLIEDLSLEKGEFDKERLQNQADAGKKAKGPKGRKGKKGKGKA